MEHFVDKIYLHEDWLVVASWYFEDNREVPMEVLDVEMEDPFVEGEAVRFDCFSSGSTQNRLWSKLAGDFFIARLFGVFVTVTGFQKSSIYPFQT
jgi:hypothetical protein ELI_2926